MIRTCFLLFFTLLNFNVFAKMIHVGLNKPCQKIKEALSFANNFDTILVYSGSYTEGNIEIVKPITLKGINKPVINGQLKYEAFSVKSNSVTIDGFKIINTGYASMQDIAAIRMYGVSNITVCNNLIENAFFGIYFTNATNCVVKNNKLIGPLREQNNVGNGIHFWKSNGNKILNNSIYGHRDGIYFEFVKNTVIAFNTSENNLRYGLHFMFSDSDNYYKNSFVNNGAGVAVMYSRHVYMLKNNFVHNWGTNAYGLLLKDISDSKIYKNNFIENSVAIHSEGSSRSDFLNNTFKSNGYAIRLQANCDENRLSFNNFFLNTFDIVTNGFTILNEFTFNYWDKYTGFDLHKDGVGDSPFRPISLFSTITENSPVTVIFIKSFLADLLDSLEKLIPGITPENFKDSNPLIKPIYSA